MKKALLPLLVCVAVLAPTAARADAGPKIRDSLWLPLGLNVGYSVNPDPLANGFLIGPELSFAYLDRKLYWAGVYADALRDFGSDTTRVSFGAEAGIAVFGLDLGYVHSYADGGQDGIRGRLLFSLVAVQLYGGVGRMSTSPEATTYGEAGLLLKFPLSLWQAAPEYRHQY